MKRLMEVLQIIGVSLTVAGSVVVGILRILTPISISVPTALFVIIALIGSLSIYLLAANKLMELRIAAVESGQALLSREVTQEEWYGELIRDVLSEKTIIQITHHSQIIPTQGGGARKKLWDALVERMGDKNILFKWIVAIASIEKLEWIVSLINENKENDNLHINYSPVEIDYPAPPQSIQLVGNKAYVIDMSQGQYVKSELGSGLISEDPIVFSQFSGYYRRYWRETIKLKEGNKIYAENLEALRKSIKK